MFWSDFGPIRGPILGPPKWPASVGVWSQLGCDFGILGAEGKAFQPPPFMSMILEDLNVINKINKYINDSALYIPN